MAKSRNIRTNLHKKKRFIQSNLGLIDWKSLAGALRLRLDGVINPTTRQLEASQLDDRQRAALCLRNRCTACVTCGEVSSAINERRDVFECIYLCSSVRVARESEVSKLFQAH